MRNYPLLALVLLCPAALAVDKVPEYAITDTFATSPTMLLRAGVNGEVREIWSGMDPVRMRHVPLFLETSIFGSVRRGGAWLDLRTLTYHHDGTRPGWIRLRSDDGFVSIEVTARRLAEAGPIFVRYAFSEPVDFRLSAHFKYPDFTQEAGADDASGSAHFLTLWRGENAVLTTTSGPGLVLATAPLGRTLSVDKTGLEKEVDGAREVLLCVDATEKAPPAGGSPSYAMAWVAALGGTSDPKAEVDARRVSLASDNPKLDRLFADSLDSMSASQFASGDVMADVFFYRDSWLRDGTYTMIGQALAGDYASVDRYFAYWTAQRDFSVGGEREAQQPAIAVTGIWFYSLLRPDGEPFLATAWPYVKFYCDYYAGRVAREGMLNLAEEWICFIPAPSSWPNAEVYSGLRAAEKIASRLGHETEARQWGDAADRLQSRFLAQAFDKEKGRLIPMAGPKGKSFTDPDFPKAENRNGPLREDRVDAGMLIIGRLAAFGRDQGIIGVDDPRFASTQAEIIRDLENPDHSTFRFGPSPGSPHAPKGELDTWPIIASWAAQDEWLLGRTDLGWRYLISGIVNKRGYDMAAMNGYLPEFWDRSGIPDKQMIVWSHGDFVTSTLLLFLGINPESAPADLRLAPSLPPGMGHAHIGNFRFRNWVLDFDLVRKDALVEVSVTSSGKAAGSLNLRLPFDKAVRLEAGGEARFTVDPSRYYLAFGRSANAPERARIISKVLLGREPLRDPDTMTPSELEDFIVTTETDYVPTNE